MQIKQIQQILAIALPLWLVGCTQGHESFSTEPGKGYGWKDMTETHREVHKGITPEIDSNREKDVWLPVPVAHPILSTESSVRFVTRIPEQSVRIWFAPYQDSFGNLHEECLVHTVMQTGRWIVPQVDAMLAA